MSRRVQEAPAIQLTRLDVGVEFEVTVAVLSRLEGAHPDARASILALADVARDAALQVLNDGGAPASIPAALAAQIAIVLRTHAALTDTPPSGMAAINLRLQLRTEMATLKTLFEREFPHVEN